MITILTPIKITYRSNSPENYRPKNMTAQKMYNVVAFQTRIRIKNDQKKVEEILYGFIGDDFLLTFVASYNCVTIDCNDKEMENEFWRTEQKANKQSQTEPA